MAKRTPLNIVNAINNQINKAYSVNLPVVTRETFSDMAGQLRSYPENVQNGWLDTLVNLVGMQIVKNKKQYESIYRLLHRQEIPTFDVQAIMVDVIKAKAYESDADADDFFADEKPEVGTQYMNSVVKLKFPVSVNEEQLYGAFISEGNFDNFMSAVITSMWSSYELADVELTEDLISQNIKEGNIRLEPLAVPVDKDTALAFTTAMQKIASKLALKMRRDYNLSGFATWTPKEDGIVMASTDVQAVIDNYALAWAFNENRLDLAKNGQYIAMDDMAGDNVYALYLDRDALEIRNIVGFPKVTGQYFGNTLTLKRWLHYWAMYTVSYFSNAVAFIKPGAIAEASAVTATLATREGVLKYNVGDTLNVYVKSLAIAGDYYYDKFGEFTISGANSADTVIDAHKGLLTIGKDETSSKITVTWTSHLDDSVTATLELSLNG